VISQAGGKPTTARRREARGLGLLIAATAPILWGSQFPVAKTLYRTVDPYTLTAIRYGVAAVAYVGALAVLEGGRALGFGGRFWRTVVQGILAVPIGVLVVYVGLQHTTATITSLLLALQPLMTAVVVRIRQGTPLPRSTLWAMLAALVGVLLVVTKGHPTAAVHGAIGWGVAMIMFGQLGWILYTVDASRFGEWSTLRYTTMTGVTGTVAMLVVLGFAQWAGVAHASGRSFDAQPGLLAYAVIGPALVAGLAWNFGRARLGPQNLSLFLNLAPVTTFAIAIVQGYRPTIPEYVGALIVIAALAGNNLAQRRQGIGARLAEAEAAPEPL
jgi:drug/metabolite transporter (DMT)-like permease